MGNNEKESKGRDERAIMAQSAMAYHYFLLNREEGDDNEKELKRGWTTRGL